MANSTSKSQFDNYCQKIIVCLASTTTKIVYHATVKNKTESDYEAALAVRSRVVRRLKKYLKTMVSYILKSLKFQIPQQPINMDQKHENEMFPQE